MITLRLNPELEQTINNTAKIMGLTKSELIRQSINEYISKLEQPNAWETGKDLFGKYSSSLGNLSENRKDLIKDKLKAKVKRQ
ncbi:MAG: CopG family transcriptional regulator [Desulfamplus sp.]|nr:CopG family transcriptional regulator [Desulfamplus sp.]